VAQARVYGIRRTLKPDTLPLVNQGEVTQRIWVIEFGYVLVQKIDPQSARRVAVKCGQLGVHGIVGAELLFSDRKPRVHSPFTAAIPPDTSVTAWGYTLEEFREEFEDPKDQNALRALVQAYQQLHRSYEQRCTSDSTRRSGTRRIPVDEFLKRPLLDEMSRAALEAHILQIEGLLGALPRSRDTLAPESEDDRPTNPELKVG
jgi:CRP-like cAMP-binding protein